MTNAEKICRELWAKIVKHRDRWCLLCGATDNLEAHHLIPKAQGNWTVIYDIDFGVTLCKEHHVDTPRGSELLEKLIIRVRAKNEDRAEKILTQLNKPIKPCPILFDAVLVKRILRSQWAKINELSWTDDDCVPGYGDALYKKIKEFG